VTQTTTERSGLVKVSVVSGERRVDLALPTAVPVAELLPELARSVGALDPETVHGGYHLVTSEGRRLSADAGLTLQGVQDGAVLAVTRGVDEAPVRVYDDIVEAMADAVESETRPWEPAAGRATALGAAAVVLGLGATALGLERPHLLAGAVAGVAALLLVTGAVVLARVQREHAAAVVLAWTAVVYAAVAGLTLAPAGPLLGLPLTLAGAGAVVVGTIGALGLAEHRPLLVPAVVVGGVVAGASALVETTALRPGAIYATALVLTVLAGSALPWLALGATRTRVEQVHSHAEIAATPREIDPAAVRADALTAHEVLLAVTATVGLLLVLVAPLAVSLGVSGALLAVCASLVLMLRTRQYRVGSEVAVGLLAGFAGLVATTVAMIVLRPEWRPALAVLLAASAVVVLVLTLVPQAPSVRRARTGDVAELVALVAMLPLLVVAAGLLAAVRS
jgi:type VII secretion integral membrane protein EccD